MVDPTPSDPDEVERLQAEVAVLRRELREREVRDSARPPRRGRWRPVVAGVLIVVGALLAPIAVVAVWARDEVGDTDRYVETVAPLADNPAIQDEITDRVTAEIVDRLDVRAITKEAVDALADRGLPPNAAAALGALSTPLSSGVRSFVHTQVGRLVHSETFAEAWTAANREAHAQAVAVLTGETGQSVEVKGDAVRVNLAAVIDTVKQRLSDRGFTLVDRLPPVNAEFTVFESADLSKAQTGFRLLKAAAHVLPFLALILLGLGVYVARDRRRAVVAACLAVAGAMVLLGLGLNFFRVVYLDAIPTDVLSASAAGAVYDALVHFIRLNLRAVLVLFLVLAVVAWVSGPAPAPSSVRRGSARAVDVVRHGSQRAGLDTGGLGVALWRQRVLIRWVVLGLALLAYVLAPHPTGAYALTLLVVAVLVLLVVEVLSRPPNTAAVPAQRDAPL